MEAGQASQGFIRVGAAGGAVRMEAVEWKAYRQSMTDQNDQVTFTLYSNLPSGVAVQSIKSTDSRINEN